MPELDPAIHQPTRLRILMLLSGVESADFTFLLRTLDVTRGNLSSHMSHLEAGGYVEVNKTFDGKIPNTSYALTAQGRAKLDRYWSLIDEIRRGGVPEDRGRRAPPTV